MLVAGSYMGALNEGLSDQEARSLKYFWLGFLIYAAMYAARSPFENAPKVMDYSLYVGLLFLVPATFYLVRFRIQNLYLKLLFFIFMIWQVRTVAIGFKLNTAFIIHLLLNAEFGIFLYFVPLILLFPIKLPFFRKLFDVISVMCVLFIILDVLFLRVLINRDQSNLVSQGTVEGFTKHLSFPVGFLLMTYRYHPKKRKILAIVTILLSILFSIIRARRGLLSMFLLMGGISYALYLFGGRKKLIVFFFSAVIAVVMMNFVASAMNKKHSIFSFLIDRLTEDTRTPVEECFNDDLKPRDWAYGRGLGGEYFCPIVEENQDINGYRAAIETGYLQIILNGGIVSLALILLMAVPAMIMGFFASKNILCKAAACWILIWMMSLYPANVATFTLNYMLVWISIAICYSPAIRNIPEVSMQEYFTQPQLMY